MAANPTGSAPASKDFDEYLKSCPASDEDAPPNQLSVVGTVLRSKTADAFTLQAMDGSRHDLPRAAVAAFAPVASGAGGRIVELTLNRGQLGEDLLARLGGIKSPIEKAPPLDTAKEIGGFDTLKETGGGDTIKEAAGEDTLKEQPFDTLKELGGGDTLKELGGGDTLKELGGGDTLKEQPFDTLKELGGGDTLKETAGGDTFKETGGGDTLKETGGGDTFKEIGGGDTLKELTAETVKEGTFDTLKEFGEGTGIADTLVEGVGQPGGEVVNPAVQARMAAAGQAPGAAAFGANLKTAGADTLKEMSFDHTLKELINDHKFIKEIVKEVVKEVAFEGTGAADTLVEGRPDFGGFTTVEGRPDFGAQGNPFGGGFGVPFVLATPHQASQGAVAQQMLAAQALAGRIGF
jgi:hypothetical protein